MSAPATPLVYDPFRMLGDPDPYGLYRRLRDDAPVYHSEEHDFFALSRFDDVQAALRDCEAFSSANCVAPDYVGKRLRLNSFQDMDPPQHDLLRRIVRAHFVPDRVKELEPVIESHAEELLSDFKAAGGGDLAKGFAWVLPLSVIGTVLGVEAQDREFLRRCFDGIFHANATSQDGLTTGFAGMQKAAEDMRAFFAAMIADRSKQPANSVLRTLAGAAEAGTVELDELSEICLLIFFAGFETTANLLSNASLLLAEHPDQRAALIAEPAGIAAAVEEFVRFDTPVQVLARDTTRPVVLHDTEIPGGARVMLIFGAANRDERRFADPDRLDVARLPVRHLGFGNGIHHCLGAPVARLESRVALECLLRQMPNYQLSGSVERSTNMVATRGVASLPVSC
jgi:cytochrome P450